MKGSSILDNEKDRIAALYQLQILETPPEEDFDDIVELASQICEAPIATIAFEDKNRFWFKAKVGIDATETPRKDALCSFATEKNNLSCIQDCSEDERLSNNPFVNKEKGVRSFAGVRLITEEGYSLGYLCVMDTKPRKLNDRQISGLQILAKQVVILLKLRLQIIQLKKTEEIARTSEELMNTIFNNSIDAVIVMDSDRNITQWNPKAEAIFGWTAEEAIGKPFCETLIPETHREEYIQKITNYQKNNDTTGISNTFETKALRKNNIEFDIALGISPAVIQGNRLFINFVSDITERVFATNKLDKQKEFYENILNSLPTDIAVFDPNHKYLFVNPGAIKDEDLRKFILGKDDFEYAAYRNRDMAIAQKRRDQFLEVASGKEIRWEDTIKDPEGMPITHLRRLFPVYNEQRELTMVIGFGLDITDRKIMEEKQAAMLKQVSTQNTQLVDFCNIVSHNLRAPLVNMSMLVSFIEETADIEEQKQLISKLNPVLENLHTTFNELVESIQIKQDLEVKSEKIVLTDYLQRTIEVLKMEINKSEADISYNFDEAPVIYYPPKYLLSIFHNLVSNALKYQSPDRKPVIRLETKRSGESIILSVQDNGLGIDLAKHQDNFFKIGKVFHRHPNAKGFGLFMTKTQVDAMDGRIWVESTPNAGSTFFVEFKKQ
ncbi:MAG: hypothetical protein K0Q79_3355 [Flavipsychrobacter sp.]|jgi:PAS domain S-box-containing protein|nr:hypothetical protein [Flavipsychrobacter sp.]